jgi:hypothetical protein
MLKKLREITTQRKLFTRSRAARHLFFLAKPAARKFGAGKWGCCPVMILKRCRCGRWSSEALFLGRIALDGSVATI